MDPRCEEIRELAPELALGIVEGEERGRALEHLADCPDCRRRVEELSEVADELLLLAPHTEAPVGLRVPGAGPGACPRRRRGAAAGFAWCSRRPRPLLAAAAITLAIVSRRPPDRLPLPPDPAAGERQGVRVLSLCAAAADAHGGTVFSYQGLPNWLLITVDPAPPRRADRAELVMDDGSQVPLSWFHLDPPGSSGGGDPGRSAPGLRAAAAAGRPGGQPLVAKFSELAALPDAAKTCGSESATARVCVRPRSTD